MKAILSGKAAIIAIALFVSVTAAHADVAATAAKKTDKNEAYARPAVISSDSTMADIDAALNASKARLDKCFENQRALIKQLAEDTEACKADIARMKAAREARDQAQIKEAKQKLLDDI